MFQNERWYLSALATGLYSCQLWSKSCSNLYEIVLWKINVAIGINYLARYSGKRVEQNYGGSKDIGDVCTKD